MRPMNTGRFQELVDAWRDGTLSEGQAAELSQMLRDSEAARNDFRIEARMHGLLHCVVAAAAVAQANSRPAGPASRPAARPFFARLQWLPLAASLLVLGLGWWTHVWTRQGPPAESISTLAFADRCEWTGPNAPREGQRLSAGLLNLRKGTAVIRFDGGAAAIITGQTALEVRSRGSAHLHRGEVVVRSEAHAGGFMLKTPASDVLDLGTEFAVKVEGSGATEIHALEGMVAYRKPVNAGERFGEPDNESPGELLSAGHAVRYDSADTALPRTVHLEARSFEQLLLEMRPARASRQTIAHESFNYPAGRRALAEMNGGDGWVHPWKLPPWKVDHPDAIVVNVGTVSGAGAAPQSRKSGAWLESPNHLATAFRQFRSPVHMDRDGVHYISAWVRWNSPSEQPPSQAQTLFALRTSADLWGEYLYFKLPAYLRPQIEHGAEETVTGTLPVPVNETQLWVAKIVSRRHGDDEIFFRIYRQDEVPGWIEPETWSVRANIRSDAHFDTLVISARGSCQRWFGDLRVGTSWRSVLPPSESHAAPP